MAGGGFHPAIKGLGEAGDLADIGDGNSCIPQLLCGRPGGDDIYPVSDQRLAEVNQPRSCRSQTPVRGLA